MPITAAEYAKFEKTDTATFIGMRLALAQGMVDIDAKKAKGEKITPQVVSTTIGAAILKEPYLIAAGTDKLVERYLNSFDPVQVKGFYDSAAGKIDAESLKAAREGKNSGLLGIGNAYNSEGLAHLKITSLGRNFQSKIRDESNGLTKDLTIDPKPLTAEQLAAQSSMEALFRKLDWADDKMYQITGNEIHKAVSPIMAHTNPGLERKYAKINDMLTELENGEAPNPSGYAQAIAEKFVRDKIDYRPTTVEEGKEFARIVKEQIVRGRSQAPMLSGWLIANAYEKGGPLHKADSVQAQKDEQAAKTIRENLGQLSPPNATPKPEFDKDALMWRTRRQ